MSGIVRAVVVVGAVVGTLVVQLSIVRAQEVFVLDGAVKMSPDGKIFSHVDLGDYTSNNPVWDGKTIRLAGAKGETVAFQVMVRAGEKLLPRVNVDVSELKGENAAIPAKQVSLFREWYVKVTMRSTSPAGSTGLGEYPDALIPADVPKFGLPIDVEAGKVQGIWADLAIPRGAKPGTYRGVVDVLHAPHWSGGIEVAARLVRIPLTLEVYDFAIPVKRHLRWRIGYAGVEAVAEHYKFSSSRMLGKESEAFRKMEEDLYKLCWEEHRFAPTTHYNSPIPESTGTGADLKIDWTSYDRRFGKYLDGSAFADKEPVNIFSLPANLHSHGGWPAGFGTGFKDENFAALAAVCKQAVKHWDEKGWRIEDTFVYVADEQGPKRYAAIKKACETILKASDNRIRTSVAFYTHFGPHGREIVKEFSGYVTMWDIAGDFMNLPALAGRQAAGDTVGFYQGSEPFQGSEALDADGLSLTTWPWIAWRYKLDTLFFYNMTEWNYFRLERRKRAWGNRPKNIWINPLNQSWRTNSQGVLIYPGQHVGVKGVIPTLRMKQVRRGMLDYEYFWLLGQKGNKTMADGIAKRIIPKALHEAVPGGKVGDAYYGKGSWERDPRKWAAARREMAEAIVK